MGNLLEDAYLNTTQKKRRNEYIGNEGAANTLIDAYQSRINTENNNKRKNFERQKADYERKNQLAQIGTTAYGVMYGNSMPELAREYAATKRISAKNLPGAATYLRTEDKAPAYKNPGSPFAPLRQTQAEQAEIEEYKKYLENENKIARQKEEEEKRREYELSKVGFYDQNNAFIRYESLERQPDYNEVVAQAKESNNPLENYYNNPINRRLSQKGITDEDIISFTNNFDSSTSRTRKYVLMSDQEKDNYNYIYGKAGKKAADQYLDSLQNTISLRGAAAQYAESKQVPGVLQIPNNVAKSFEGGVKGAVEGFKALPDFVTGNARDYVPKEHEYYQSLLLDDASWTESMAYKAASAIGNMAPSIATGMVAGKAAGSGSQIAKWAARGAAQESVFATQIAGQQYREDIMEGRPVEGAQMNAILTALDEAATNWLLGGISNLGGGTIKKLLGDTKIAKAAKQGISNAFAKNPAVRRAVLGAMNYGADMLSEGTQEATQDFTEALRKHYIYGDKLNLKGVATDPQTWEDFALGAITAGIMNAPGAVANNVAINQYGKSIEQDYREYAQGIDTNRESYTTEEDHRKAVELQQLAEEYAARQANKEMISNRDKAEYEIALQNFQNDVIQHMSESEGTERVSGQETTAREATVPQNQPEIPQTKEIVPVAQKLNNVAYNAIKTSKSALEEWAKPFGAKGQEVFKDVYDGEADLGAYYRAFGRAYNIGRYNMQPTQQQQAEAAVILGTDGFSEAFKAGVHDRPEIGYDQKTGSLNRMVMGQKKEGGLGTVAENATEAQKKVATHIGKLTGLQIDLVDSLDNQNAAASYSKGKITLSVNSSDFMGSTSHELTHYIKDYAPDAYQVYTDHAVRAIMESKGTDLETVINDYITAYEQQTGQQLSREEATDEIVADATQKFLNDPDFISRAVKEDSTIGQRIIDFLTDVIDAIKELVKTGSTRRTAKALEENLQYFEQCRQEWLIGLEEAGVRYKAGWENETKTEPKYKLEKPDQVTDEHIEENYETVRNMDPVAKLTGNEFAKGEKDLISQVVDYYNSVGGKVHNEVVGDIYLTKESAKDDVAHGIGRLKAITFAAVPEVLKQGRVLDYEKEWKGRKYDSVVLGAPITVLDGKHAGDYYEIAIVKVAEDNKMYVHEVYAQKMKEPIPFKTPSIPQSGSRSGNTPSSVFSIFEKLLNVNDSKDIRYQLVDVDSEGNDLSQQQKDYFAQSKVRDKDGKLLVLYHGTPNAGFTEFRDGTYFTPDKAYADLYHDPNASLLTRKQSQNNPDTYKVYLNIEKPFDTRLPEVKRIWDEQYYRQWGTGTPLMESGLPDWTDGMDIQEFIEDQGLDFDGIILDEGGYMGNDGEVKSRGLSYIVMNPSQVKNVDNKAPTKSKDIRYQLEDVDLIDRKVQALQYENENLKEANELLKKQFELTGKSIPRQEDVKKVANKYLKQYNSDYSPEVLSRNVGRLYEYIRSAEQVDGAEVTELATGIARSLLKKSKSTSEFSEQYQGLRKQIQGTKIMITDQDKADLAQMGGYNNFRKQYFGKLKLGNEGISVDSLYQELSSQYPELFPTDVTHPADQLLTVAAAMDNITERVQNPYHANLDEMSYIVGQDILMDYFEVRPEPPTFADRKAAEVRRVRMQYQQKMSDYKNELRQKYNDSLNTVRRQNIEKVQELAQSYKNLTQAAQREYKDYYKSQMDALRNDKNQAMAAMQQRRREQLQQRRESLRAREAKKSILRERQALETWLLKPTDSKHIPQALRTTVAEFLRNIDFSSASDEGTEGVTTQRTEAWNKAKIAFDKIIDSGAVKGDNGEEYYMEIDPDLKERLAELTGKVNGIKRLDELDAYSLEELKKVINSMKKAITEMNSLKSNRKSGELSILADGVFQDLSKLNTRAEYTGLAGMANHMLNYDMLDPQSMFGEMGDSMKSTYDSLRHGLDQKTKLLKLAQDYINNLMNECGVSSADIRMWSGRKSETKAFRVAGGTIDLTIPQIMSLYELSKRNQAKGHLYDRNGGIKHAPKTKVTKIVNGKVVLGRIDKQFSPVRVTEADVQNIINTLTPEQKRLADGLQKFMGNEIAQWGNDITMEMYGYQKFTAKDYFPIIVDKNRISTKEGDLMNQMSTIKNMGITKNTNEHAHNPIIIEDIFDVYTRQVDQMSSYNAYVIPLSDLNKVWNYQDMRNGKGSIKQEIERTIGKEGNEYIKKLILDINGSINQEKSIADKALSNMKAASVAGNLRVAIQQPTAYIRASMEIDPQYLLKGAFTLSEKDQWEKVCKYAPIAQWKDWGFYRMDTSRQLKDILMGTDSAVQRAVNFTMTGAEMGDKIAWQRLWRACEYECIDQHPELKQGTEEFYEKVGERFSEIIDKTQVVDSTLHRTQIMRKNGLDKYATAFMAEPLKTFDMLYRATMDVKNGKPGAKSRATKAAAVFVATNVVTALAASVIDALRDDDREKTWGEKYKENVIGNIKDNMNLLNNIPYVRDVISTFEGFTPARADATAYQDLYYAYLKLKKLYEGDSNLTPQYVAAYTVQMTSKLLGMPIRNISRDAGALIDTAYNAAGGEADYKWLRQQYDIAHDDNRKIYARMILEAKEAGNMSLAETIRDDMIAAGADPEKISLSIDGIIKKRYEDDDRIQEAAQARIDGRPEDYKRIYEEILNDPSYESSYPDQVQKLIKSAQTKLKGTSKDTGDMEEIEDQEEIYTSIYTNADMISALEAGNRDGFISVADDLYNAKIAAGKSKKEALSSIRQVITSKFKKKYKEAKTREEKDEIIKLMNTLKVNGQYIYSGYDYSSWRK